MRAVAILMVVHMHSISIFKTSDAGFLNWKYPDPVDLFFVLSGFLIGLLLLRKIEKHEGLTLKTTIGFLSRRWFRTLPNYYLFLIVNIILISFSLIPGTINKYLVTYFGFFQNFHKPYDFLYWESWSLSVEEWFYISFPLVILLFLQFKKWNTAKGRKLLLLGAILTLTVTPLIIRITQSDASLSTELYFRKLVITRLDTISYGILAAYLCFYFPLFWKKIRHVALIAGLLGIALLTYTPSQSVFFSQTIYYSLMALSCALLLPFLSHWRRENQRFKPIAFVSKVSYSMYLIHLPLLHILIETTGYDSFATLLLYWTITLILSGLNYKYFEMPLMNLRDRPFFKKLNQKR